MGFTALLRPGCYTVYHFVHLRPVMLSILLDVCGNGYMKPFWYRHIQYHLHSKPCRWLSVMLNDHTSQEVARKTITIYVHCIYSHNLPKPSMYHEAVIIMSTPGALSMKIMKSNHNWGAEWSHRPRCPGIIIHVNLNIYQYRPAGYRIII